MRSMFAVGFSVALAACTPQPNESAPATATDTARAVVSAPAPSPATDTTPVPAPAVSLVGEWRVAGIDGAEFNEPYGLALTGSARELWWEPRCARVARSYRAEGAAIEFGPALDAPKPGDPPPAVCAIALPPRLADVVRALDAATTIGRTASNGVEISGGGHSLLLFSQ